MRRRKTEIIYPCFFHRSPPPLFHPRGIKVIKYVLQHISIIVSLNSSPICTEDYKHYTPCYNPTSLAEEIGRISLTAENHFRFAQLLKLARPTSNFISFVFFFVYRSLKSGVYIYCS